MKLLLNQLHSSSGYFFYVFIGEYLLHRELNDSPLEPFFFLDFLLAVMLVSSDKLNEHADVVEVVYLTTKEKRLMPTHAEVLCKIPSTALCETIYTVNKDRLGDFVRTCTDKEMEGVNAGILCSLGIAAPVVDGEPVDNSVTVERNLYKHLYEDLLNKVMAR